jgi:hypothetical protein
VILLKKFNQWNLSLAKEGFSKKKEKKENGKRKRKKKEQ